jgi:hypothetical protein
MQPLRFIPQATRESADRGSTLLLWPAKLHFRKPVFRKPGKPRIAPAKFGAKITARRNRSDEVRWKNLLRRLEFRRLPEIRPDFRLLELAKGFEPPTP